MEQDDFSDRLRRIEARKGPSDLQNPEPAIRSARKRKSSGNLRPTLIIATMLFGAIGAMWGILYMERGGSFSDIRDKVAARAGGLDLGFVELPSFQEVVFESAMDNQQEKLAERRAAEAEARARTLIAPPRAPREVPTEPVATARLGTVFGASYAASQSGTPIALDSIMVGFQPTGPDTPIGAPEFFEYNSECTLRPVGTAEKFINVNVGYAQNEAPVQMLDDAVIHASLEDAIKEAIGDGHSPGMLSVARGGRSAIDVIVTDTSAPLYMMLQTLGGNIIWNIHAAPGVEIAHIALVANASSGLTGNIGDASFEAIRAADFGNQMDFYSYRGEPEDLECMARPFRKPDESWGAWAGAKRGNTLDGNLLFMRDNGHDAYDHWFTQTMGFGSAENLLSANEAGAVLVGNLSSELFSAPDAPGTFYVERHDHILTGPAAAREAETIRLYSELVAQAAGGDHRGTIPEPQDLGGALAEAAVVGGQRRNFGEMVMNNNVVEEVVSLTELNGHRTASLSQWFTMDDMLADDEAMPPEELRDIYAMLRGPKLLQAFCKDTLVEIASKCSMYRASVRSFNRNDMDAFEVRADFAYIPNYAIGDVTRISNGEFISAGLRDQLTGRGMTSPEDRRAFLADIEKVCDELRKEYGNCLIDTAKFFLDRPSPRDDSAEVAQGFGSVSVYTVETRFEEGNLLEKAEEILAQIQTP